MIHGEAKLVLGVLSSYAAASAQKFGLPGTVSPEDQLKPLVAELICSVGQELNLKIDTRTEIHLSELSVRPDMAVYVSGLISGYVELKQPGLGANASQLKGPHNKEQWQKLKNLPNLVYTDGRDWALYRRGELVSPIIRFKDDPSVAGKKAITAEDAKAFEALLRDFLSWEPQVPHKPTELATYLAPLTRFLRSEVEQALLVSSSAVSLLAEEWRNFFFPDADDPQFADAYAQTITYAMLLARLSGANKLAPAEAAKTLDKGNGLLARTLELLGQSDARDELRVGFELLQRSLEALKPEQFLKTKPDLWLYFYEDFLAAYDPKLRKDYGVYYTPREVVELQVKLTTELLDKRFKKKLGFADDGVVFLDPAVGTGTYLVASVAHALDRVSLYSGSGAVPARATQMAENMYGFEILVGPYAVAHLRLKQAIEGAGGTLPEVGGGKHTEKRVKIYLADTLESPFTTPPGGLDLTHRKLTEEREAARKLKQGGEILVCIGNPPYDRQQVEQGDTTTHRKGGWVRFGDQIKGGAKSAEQGDKPILSDFLEPVTAAGQGVHLKNIYNDYVYFWRWALWRLFERQNCGGIVTFITASSYLAGPGFVGVREVMRRTFDELWIIDLGGDNLGTRKSPNVFNIQTPVAIAIGVRGSKPKPDNPAEVRYARVTGESREEKLSTLSTVKTFSDLSWSLCPKDWHKPLLPLGTGDFFDWPRLEDLFPWAHSGAQFKRSWPIGETKDVIEERFKRLRASNLSERARLFRESRDRKITFKPKGAPTSTSQSVYELTEKSGLPLIEPYSFRSFDTQWALIDTRFGDYLRPSLASSVSDKQVFLTTLLTEPLAKGPAVVAAAHLPDLHHFRGSFGGRDVFPLWRDKAASEPNLTFGMLAFLEKMYGHSVSPQDFCSYVYAVLGSSAYTALYWNELETPGPRVPITKSWTVFEAAVSLGRRLLWLHTYGKRFAPLGEDENIPHGLAKCEVAIPNLATGYPETFEYFPGTKKLHVGGGVFGPISPEVWCFEVSGLQVISSWLGYRMKKRSGKRSSPLDDIRPERWTPRMTDELLELLWLVEATLDTEPGLEEMLKRVVNGSCFKASELPSPTALQKIGPDVAEESEDQLSLSYGEDE